MVGVLQGNTLAPYLFIILRDYALRKEINGKKECMGFQTRERKSRQHQAEYVTDLDFADDIAFLSGEIHQAQALLKKAETMAASIGLAMNAKKTQVLAFNQDKEVYITSKGEAQLDVAQDLKYLGSWMS